jgi:predicted MFS family arabinose efflux permease
MLVLVCVCVGVVMWSLLGGRVPSLDALHLRRGGLIFAALALQLAIFTPAAERVPATLIVPTHLASYALMGLFLVLNWRRFELLVLASGFIANAAVIAVNDGRMPISLAAWTATGRPAEEITATGAYNNNVLAGPHTHLAWLGDVFPLPHQVPFANSLSVGDLLIIAGALLLITSAGRPARFVPQTLLGPLALAEFRRLMFARGASQVGDWITIAATVTWIYTRTHSTVWLSAFMIIRIGAATAGGLIAASRLGRATPRTVSILVVLRGALTLLALLPAAHGNLVATLTLLALSAALSAPAAATTSALLPIAVDAPRLHAANALVAFTAEIAMVTGTAIASLLATHFSFVAALAIDATTFAVSAAVYLRLRMASPASDASADRRQTERHTLSVVLRAPTVAALLASFCVTTAGIGILNSSLPRFLAQATANANAYGYAMAAIGTGAVIGGLLAGTSGREIVVRRLLPLSFAAMAIALLVIAQSRVEATILLLLLLLGAADATTEVSYSTILQRHVSSDRLAAALSLGSAGVNAGMIVGFASAAILSQITAPTTGIKAASALCLVGALIATLLSKPMPRRRRAPQPPHWPSSMPRRVDLHRISHRDLIELAAQCGIPASSQPDKALRNQLHALRAGTLSP